MTWLIIMAKMNLCKIRRLTSGSTDLRLEACLTLWVTKRLCAAIDNKQSHTWPSTIDKWRKLVFANSNLKVVKWHHSVRKWAHLKTLDHTWATAVWRARQRIPATLNTIQVLSVCQWTTKIGLDITPLKWWFIVSISLPPRSKTIVHSSLKLHKKMQKKLKHQDQTGAIITRPSTQLFIQEMVSLLNNNDLIEPWSIGLTIKNKSIIDYLLRQSESGC